MRFSSSLPKPKFGMKVFEFNPSIIRSKLPIERFWREHVKSVPRRKFMKEQFKIWNASAQTLS